MAGGREEAGSRATGLSVALLEVREVSKSFRGLRAVSRVSFDVGEGAIVGLIGPNGAGKTTTFNMVAGVFGPDGGEIRFEGRRIDGLRPDQVCAAGIGRTFQIVRPFAGLSVLDNVIVGALKRTSGVAAARQSAAQILDQLGLGAKRDLPASALTLPDRKRLEVARALATRPRLLLLDEVMAGLRPTECDQMVAAFRDINRGDGLTVLLIEHVMRAVMALARELVVLHHGEVLARGAPEEVVRNAAVLQCYLGEETVI
jgi:branched-chain amino acid transport system ATP-binding protein